MRALRVILTAALFCSALVGVQMSQASAGGCSDTQKQLANRIGGECSDWHVIRDGFDNYVGAKFRSSDDTRLKAPSRGRLDTACGQLWSTQKLTRRIWLTEATYWRFGSHNKLCGTPLNSAMAGRLLGGTPFGQWTRIEGSESTGWALLVAGDSEGDMVSLKRLYHGRLDTPNGCFYKGQQPTPQHRATFWYNGGNDSCPV